MFVMFTCIRNVAITAALLVSTGAPAAEMTGNDVYLGCLHISQGAHPTSAAEAMAMGFCAGLVAGTMVGTNRYVCQPDGVVTGQGVAILVRFLDVHPERRHEKLSNLALEALATAWPCSTKSK